MDIEALKTQIESATFDPELQPDPYQPLDDLVDAAEDADLLPLVTTVTGKAISGQGVDLVRYYLNFAAHMKLGNPEKALEAEGPLAGRLEQEQHWNALSRLAIRSLEAAPRVEAALQLAKALESAGLELVEPSHLKLAYDNFPGETRLIYLMGQLRETQAQGHPDGLESEEAQKLTSEAQFFWAESLAGFISNKKTERAEEVVMKIVESGNADALDYVHKGLETLAEQKQWGRFQTILEMSLPAFRENDMVREVWDLMLKSVPHAPASLEARKLLAELAPEAFPHTENIVATLEQTGILDPEKNVDAAMKALEPLIAFAPGFHVLHASWGVGKLRDNDGQSLVIDFQEAAGHRMSLNLARRALEVIPADDLRVLVLEQPNELKSMLKEDPARVAFLGIRMLGGQAKTQDLKRAMVGASVMTPSRWTTFWKDAKAAMDGDPRFDLSQGFRQVYAIRKGSDIGEEIAMPVIEPRRGIRPNLNLIRRFLEQHPAELPRASRTYTSILERWAREERTNAEDRMVIHLQLYRWRRSANDEFRDALRQMLQNGTEASAFTDLEDQRLIVQTGLETENLWKEAAFFALSSRYAEVRQMAFERIREAGASGTSLLRELVQDPSARPMAALAVINSTVHAREGEDAAAVGLDLWDAALGAATLIESTSRDQVRKQALTLMASEGMMAAKLAQNPPTDLQLERWDIVLRRWRSSERYLQPILNVLSHAGLDEFVNTVRSARVEKTNQLLESHAHRVDYSGTWMTRATFERLRAEVEKLNYEVKTTVADAIAKARAHGDLRENAEYDAARKKQADYMERIAANTQRLTSARIIDDLQAPPDEAAPGTYVELEDVASSELKAYWLLGEGDDVYGSEVISYASPLGRSLLGKKAGERISLIREDGVHELVIRSVANRLPDVEEVAAATSAASAGPSVSAGSPGSAGTSEGSAYSEPAE